MRNSVNSDLPLAESVRSHGKAERKINNEGSEFTKTIIYTYSKQTPQIPTCLGFQDILFLEVQFCTFW